MLVLNIVAFNGFSLYLYAWVVLHKEILDIYKQALGYPHGEGKHKISKHCWIDDFKFRQNIQLR